MHCGGELMLAVALAVSTGLRAFLPLLVTRLLERGGIVPMNHAYAFVTSDPALLVFGAAAAPQIAADKIPGVDHLLDGCAPISHPAARTLLASSVLARTYRWRLRLSG